jgi:HD-GYP domain-containing protein (c-di-GMP phosphodiesterase class II)
MGLEPAEVRLMGIVGKLHDIGKVAVPDVILQSSKQLTEAQWTLIKQHPIIGAEVVSHVPTLRIAAPGIRGHHERWDGKGYPDRLAGDAIPLAARVVMVADAFNAMTTDRPYRKARSQAAALHELRRCAGTQFDPEIVTAVERLCADVMVMEMPQEVRLQAA